MLWAIRHGTCSASSYPGRLTAWPVLPYLAYLAQEKLCPILAMYKAADYEQGVKMAHDLIMYGGAGHTSVLYTNPLNTKHIHQFQDTVKTVRILINTPASQGAIGDLYNFHLDPSLTLGCGSWGSTSVSTNVGPQYLLNVKTVTARRENMLWFRVPPKVGAGALVGYVRRGWMPRVVGK